MREKKIRKLAEIIGRGVSVKKNINSLKNKENEYLLGIIKLLCEL